MKTLKDIALEYRDHCEAHMQELAAEKENWCDESEVHDYMQRVIESQIIHWEQTIQNIDKVLESIKP